MKHPISKEKAPVVHGSVKDGELLLVRELCHRLGWERKTLVHAKRDGLKTIRFGRWDYVRGKDALAFFDQLAERQAGEGSP